MWKSFHIMGQRPRSRSPDRPWSKHPPAGTQAVDRAARSSPGGARRRAGQLHRARRSAACPVHHLAAARRARAHRPARAPRRGGYVAGGLFALHAASHDPWQELVRIARPTLEAVGEQTGETVHLGVARGDRVAHSPRSTRRTSSAPATGPRSRCPRTAPRWARCCSPTACSPLPAGPLERRTTHTVTDREALRRELRAEPAARLRHHRRRARDRSDRRRGPGRRQGGEVIARPRRLGPDRTARGPGRPDRPAAGRAGRAAVRAAPRQDTQGGRA